MVDEHRRPFDRLHAHLPAYQAIPHRTRRALPGEAARLGLEPLIVSDRGLEANGVLATALEFLRGADGLPTCLDVPSNPTEVAARAALKLYRSSRCDCTDRFMEDVSSIGDVLSINELVSEGVLGRTGGRLSFFHQTFAEFAVAKHLAAKGSLVELERLGSGLLSRTSGYWGVVGHLILHDLSDQRFEAILGVVPIDHVEGARVSILGALARPDVEHGARILREIAAQRPDEFVAAADLLQDAGDEYVRPVVDILTDQVATVRTYLTGVVRVFAALIARLPSSEAAASLAKTLDAMVERYRQGTHQQPGSSCTPSRDTPGAYRRATPLAGASWRGLSARRETM